MNVKNHECNTALHEAAWTIPDLAKMKDKDTCCRELIEQGADVLAKNKEGKSPADFELLKQIK